jgi:dienelactone hydrolase
MAEVLLLHHAQGRTSGIDAFADELRQAGHTVHVPDLFGGRTFDSIEEGVAYAEQVGFGEVVERGKRAAEPLPAELVYIGFSLGVMSAQTLAQTRPGARGAVLVHSCVPAEYIGTPWPDGVPVQVHGMERDPFFADEGDLEAAQALVKGRPDAELFVYPGEQHLFADASLPSYDEAAAQLLTQRVLDFLEPL